MRVTTYSQPMAAPRGSVFAIFVLVMTVILGSSALHTLMTHFAPQLHSGIAVLWLVSYLAAFMGLMFGHGINWISWLSRYRILLVILLLGTTVSVSWSLEATVSAERVVHLLGCSVLAIYLGFMIPLLTTLRVTGVVLGFIMLASLAAALFMPSVGMQEYEGKIVWSGILNSKNALGFWAAIAVLLYVNLSSSSTTMFMKMVCYLFAGVSLFVLIKSESATSLLAMFIAGALSLYLYIAFRFQLGFVRMVVMAVLFLGVLSFVASNIDTAEIVGRSGDLTGRGEVWRQTWKLIMNKPLTGYGYGAIWFPTDATIRIQESLTDFTWTVYHAHNGFLQVASEIGLPLSCIALLMVAQQLIEIFYCQYERQQVGVLFVMSFVVAYLISNFSEARFLVNRELYWIFFLALPISMLRQINLMSVDDVDNEQENAFSIGPGGQYAHPGVPIDKPWLRPIVQREAARIGTAGGMVGGAESLDDTSEHSSNNESRLDQTRRLATFDDTDIDLGDEHANETQPQNVQSGSKSLTTGELDASYDGDHTLDTTQVVVDRMDNTLEDMESTQDDDHGVIRPYEEYVDDEPATVNHSDDLSDERFNVDDTGIRDDRYDKNIDDDDEDDWVDISLDDPK